VEYLADLDTAGDELIARSLDVGDGQVQASGPEPGVADVRFVPNWIEQPEPGGVNWIKRKSSPGATSASSLQPRLP